MTRKTSIVVSGILDQVPEDDDKIFREWCEYYGFHFLGGGRRAWCSSLSTYLRDAKYLFTTEMGDMLLLYDEPIQVESDE